MCRPALWKIEICFCTVMVLSFSSSFATLSVSARQSADAPAGVRACNAQETDAGGGKKPVNRKKGKGQTETNMGEACVEVHSASLDVQEQLQAFVRKQKWRAGEEEIGESFWSFSMALSKEELLDYATPDPANERVEWRSGKAVVLVKTADLRDGYARTIVTAHFEGFGEPQDTFAMKRESWTLRSNGKLEATLTSALEAHNRAHH